VKLTWQGLDRRTRLAIIVLLLLALVLRIGWVLNSPHYTLCCDAGDYDNYAVTLATTHSFPQQWAFGGPTAFRPPLYPLALGALYWVGGLAHSADRVEVARLVQALLGAITAGLVGLLAYELFRRRRVALLALAISAVYLPFIFYGESILTEPLFLPLELGAVIGVLRYRRLRPGKEARRWLLLAGALAGLCALTRPNGPILALALALCVLPPRPWRSVRVLTAPALLLLVCGAVVLPWLVRNEVKLGAPVLTTSSGFGIAGTYNSAAAHDQRYPADWQFPPIAIRVVHRHRYVSAVKFDRIMRDAAFSYIGDHPFYPLKVAYWNTVRILQLDPGESRLIFALDPQVGSTWADLARYSFYLLALLALGSALIPAARRAPRAGWVVPGVLFITIVFVWGSNRYREPIDPFVVAYASMTLATLVGFAQRRIRQRAGPEVPDEASPVAGS
jgi:4-amino-4-deoxy-L-arabinose transferase-like glycosyltransferase